MLKAFVPVLLAASFTSTVNENVPAVVGVPEITPVEATNVQSGWQCADSSRSNYTVWFPRWHAA